MQNSVIVYHNPHNIAQERIDKVIIWLHGIGADGYNFVPIVPELNLPCAVKFIFPHAPQQAVTVNGGYIMPSWYDILEMGDVHRKINLDDLQHSAQRIQTIIDEQIAQGIALENIIIVGFSQGGAVAYHVALQRAGLGGLIAISTYIASAECFQPSPIADKNLPILICHGEYDTSVSPEFSQRAMQQLLDWQYQPVRKLYPTAHSISPDEIREIAQWLHQCFD